MDLVSKLKQSISSGSGGFSGKAVLFIAALGLVCFIVWLKFRGTYETQANIRDIVSTRFAAANSITAAIGLRKGLRNLLETMKTTPDTQLLLTNFYISTVNVTGLFFPEEVSGDSPSKQEYVFSPQAVSLACKAGARAFVLDIWPSLDPQGGFRPVLQVVQEGSLWRRMSMNTMDVSLAIETIVNEIYTRGVGTGERDTTKDLCILYLRFRGYPRKQTYKGVAEALVRHAQPYFLDPSFAYARGMDRLFKTSLRNLQSKILLCTNLSKKQLQQEGQPIFPYINMCAASCDGRFGKDLEVCRKFIKEEPIKIEYAPHEMKNLVGSDVDSVKRYVQNTVAFSIPSPFEETTVTNKWDWNLCKEMGIHCIPMNVFKPSAYQMSLFNTHSYSLKPAALQLQVTVLAEPALAQNPGTGNGMLQEPTALNLGTLDTCKNVADSVIRDTEDAYTQIDAYDTPVSATDKKYIRDTVLMGVLGSYTTARSQLTANNCNAEEFKTAIKPSGDRLAALVEQKQINA